ncbi:hypothetical protein K493DRAFT_360407 [Basidiobolus meristosporus CBS 931.73]|uniref:N-acetyltransferase domain-containing protein n=1 Tax=Basidiobolus meristosporus CBS 931.73 TaxID=1314790 RepID=A0A1Y1XI41_9FUNG|nr:hypothetical protein K493DRAFT_360407 [Basidiobolus meristosporus CBS 931.73]|eukprot:ORX85441.1 hypothetical protein K493DRAFT_360407 [Basidiobolus meristosporus CBS 931.73]
MAGMVRVTGSAGFSLFPESCDAPVANKKSQPFQVRHRMATEPLIEYTFLPLKSSPLSKHRSEVIQKIQVIEKKTFPKNECMPIEQEAKKLTNTLAVAYYFQTTKGEKSLKPEKTLVVVGYLIYTFSKVDSTVRIIKVAVDKSFRGRGIATNLMTSALGKARELCTQELRCQLHVDPARTEAVNLYLKMGFEVEKRMENYYAENRHADLMCLKL